MKLTALELHRLRLPLVTPFRTSFGTQTERELMLLRVVTPESEGWGECVAMEAPLYSYETVETAAWVLRTELVPRVLALGDRLTAARVGYVTEPVKGHPMAKAALELAVLDAELRAVGRSFGDAIGSVHETVPSGVSVGIMDTIPQLLAAVGDYLDQGYVRIKLKIQPGWDLEPIRAVREKYGDVPLQVDANTAYVLGDARHLARLDDFDLLLIEQPLPEDDVRGHAALARLVRTPICLDESITSARSAADAIALGACSVINIKAGRVGGYLEAVRVHDVAQAHGVPVWCGGMLETGVGRAANIALASLPGFTLPGDTSASDRFYTQDVVTSPIVLEDGQVRVPTGPGLGIEVDRDVLTSFTANVERLA